MSSCFHLHKGFADTFRLRGMHIAGAARDDIELGRLDQEKTLLVNCTGLRRSNKKVLSLPPAFQALQAFEYRFICIDIDWPDGSVPAILPEFWRELPRLAIAEGFTRMVPYCLGSHGRTGTALAAMLILNRKQSAARAVATVRRRHCDMAVETAAQVEYLQDTEAWAIDKGLLKSNAKGVGDTIEGSYSLRIRERTETKPGTLHESDLTSGGHGSPKVTDFANTTRQAWRDSWSDDDDAFLPGVG